jgi:hypothetical protein
MPWTIAERKAAPRVICAAPSFSSVQRQGAAKAPRLRKPQNGFQVELFVNFK